MQRIYFIFTVVLLAACQTKPSQEDMDAYIKDYLDRHGVEFLDENIDKYLAWKREKGRQAEEPEIQEKLANPLKDATRSGMPTTGPEKAEIHIILFGDFEDPYSARVRDSILTLMQKYSGKISWSYRYRPIQKFKYNRVAAYAAEAAHRQGKFWEMMHMIYDRQHLGLEKADYIEWAKLLELNVERFKKDFSSDEIKKVIEMDVQYAEKNGIKSVPAVVINGGLFYGARDLERFERIIDTILRSKN